ncbi:MAG: GNAT family protein [Endozoicomonas sp. (ex Botrylloides leachii)]|nr:GNAT family protein [Endozoicomonas sp. (ex Botrylloides leachii)]
MRFELGDNYCLRSFLYGDAILLVKHGNNENIAKYLRDSFPHPYTIEHARAWVKYVKEHEADTRFAVTYRDEAIGEIGFVRQPDIHRFSAEIGYWLSEEHWGKGIMSKAVSAISQYAFEQHGMVRLFADVVEYNKGSRKLLAKCGYQLEGVLPKHIYKSGQFYNQYIYGLVR